MTGPWLSLLIGKVSGVALITQLLTVIFTLQTPTVQFIAGVPPPPPCALASIALKDAAINPKAATRVTALDFILDPPLVDGLHRNTVRVNACHRPLPPASS